MMRASEHAERLQLCMGSMHGGMSLGSLASHHRAPARSHTPPCPTSSTTHGLSLSQSLATVRPSLRNPHSSASWPRQGHQPREKPLRAARRRAYARLPPLVQRVGRRILLFTDSCPPCPPSLAIRFLVARLSPSRLDLAHRSTLVFSPLTPLSPMPGHGLSLLVRP